MKLRDLADRLGCRLEGDGEVEIARVATLDQAVDGDVTFLANPKYEGRLPHTRASAVIMGSRHAPAHPVPEGCAVLRHDDPYLAFAHAVRLFNPPPLPPQGIHSTAIVASDARLGDGVSIGPYAVIAPDVVLGDRTIVEAHSIIGRSSRLGDDCVIRTRVSIRDGIVIGHRVVVQDGAVIGSEGFGFVTLKDRTHFKIPQRGALVIEDDVEIGANTTIDRPAVGETRIGAGTKIDNLVQIAHGVSVGQRVLLAAQVGIAGSCVIEDDVIMAGQVGIAGHLKVGKGAVLAAQSGVTGHVEAGAFLTGYPAIDNLQWRKSQVLVKHLPELKKRIGELEQKIAELEGKLAACQTPSDPS